MGFMKFFGAKPNPDYKEEPVKNFFQHKPKESYIDDDIDPYKPDAIKSMSYEEMCQKGLAISKRLMKKNEQAYRALASR